MRTSFSRRVLSRWPVLGALLLVAYLGLLLFHLQRTEARLETATLQRLTADSQRRAATLDEFSRLLRQNATDFAELRPITHYLISHSLGMSYQYGLAASLAEIDAALETLVQDRRYRGEPLYTHITFHDETGAVLAGLGGGFYLPFTPTGLSDQQQFKIDFESGRLIVVAPVIRFGKVEGAVVTVSSLSLLSSFLVEDAGSPLSGELLLTDEGQVIAPKRRDDSLASLSREQLRALANWTPNDASDLLPLDGSKTHVLRTPVPELQMSLITGVPETVLGAWSRSTGAWLAVGLVPLLLLAGGGVIEFFRRRALRLAHEVKSSEQRGRELSDRNAALSREIDRRCAAEGALRQSEWRSRTAMLAARQGWLEIDVASESITVSEECVALLGENSPSSLDHWAELIHPDDVDRAVQAYETCVAHGASGAIEYRYRHPERGWIWLRSVGSVVERDAAGRASRLVGMHTDITDRKLDEERIRSLAYFDPLTELPNRRLLMEQLAKALAASERSQGHGALLMCDLDHFKKLNDSQGHDLGDCLLKEVGRRIAGQVRSGDTVARLGGDEFVVLVEDLDRDEPTAARRARRLAEKIAQAISRRYSIGEPAIEYHTSTSIGLTLFRGSRVSPDVLMKQADVALYQAKDGGRNTVRFFNPRMQAEIDLRTRLEADLRKALEHGGLCLHFQPQVNASGALVGAEALLRWHHPERGMIPPAQFIPLAEESGLILPLGQWVLDSACAQWRAWAELPRARMIPISVNVSARQLAQPDFVERLKASLNRHGVPPRQLKLEITESVLIDQRSATMARLDEIASLGVMLSLDDFGTGYSSLNYLKRLPLAQIKIDQSFVRHVLSDPSDAAIVRTVIAIGASLNLEVVAEGVETAEQRDFLLLNGCSVFQGYWVGEPQPPEEWEANWPTTLTVDPSD